MSEFSDRVLFHFGDLMAKHGFELTRADSSIGEIVEFNRQPLRFIVGWYKGEIDESFALDLQFAIRHSVFRPYVSRDFPVPELVLRADATAYETSSGVGSILTLAQADLALAKDAEIVAKYCSPILGGDLSELEAITIERRAKPHA